MRNPASMVPQGLTCSNTENKRLRTDPLGTRGCCSGGTGHGGDTGGCLHSGDILGSCGPYAVAGMAGSMGTRPVVTQVSLRVSPVQTQIGDTVSGPSKGFLSHGPHCTPRHNACWRGLVTFPLLHGTPASCSGCGRERLSSYWGYSSPVTHSKNQGRKPLSRAINPISSQGCGRDTLYLCLTFAKTRQAL